jgi:hypothetical protein
MIVACRKKNKARDEQADRGRWVTDRKIND